MIVIAILLEAIAVQNLARSTHMKATPPTRPGPMTPATTMKIYPTMTSRRRASSKTAVPTATTPKAIAKAAGAVVGGAVDDAAVKATARRETQMVGRTITMKALSQLNRRPMAPALKVAIPKAPGLRLPRHKPRSVTRVAQNANVLTVYGMFRWANRRSNQ